LGPLPSSAIPQWVEQQSRSEAHATDCVVQQTSFWQWAVVQSLAEAHAPPTARWTSHVPVTARHVSDGPATEGQHLEDVPQATPWPVQQSPVGRDVGRHVP
jgi:hypothetical protein